MIPVLAALRLLWLLACLLQGLLTQWLCFPFWSQRRRELATMRWASTCLKALNVRVHVQGQVSPGPVLLVCNHVSWLDILVIHSQFFSRFVSKGEVHTWPLIGRMAQQAGTLFIERTSRKDALRVVHDMACALGRSEVLMVFPEGTTSDGETLLPFHANLLQAAIVAGAPIQPMGLSYWQSQSPTKKSQAPRFVGQDTLVASVWRVVCSRGVQARLSLGFVQPCNQRNRREWARDLHHAVSSLISS